MSLVRIAARIAAVQALKGKTLVGTNVLDSQIGALDVSEDGTLQSDEPKPFISIYTDEAKSDNNLVRSWTGNGRTEFLFEAGVTAAHLDTNPETGESILYPGVPDTDAAFEFHLDMVARQIGDALSDPDNEWAEIFRKFLVTTERIDRARTSGSNNGVRLAAHQVKLTAQLVTDPVKGVPIKPESVMGMFFAKAATLDDPAIAAQVALMQEQVGGTVFDWQTSLRRYGITRNEADSMLITMQPGAEPDMSAIEINTQPAQITGAAS